MCFFEWGGDGVEQYVREHVCFFGKSGEIVSVFVLAFKRKEEEIRQNELFGQQ